VEAMGLPAVMAHTGTSRPDDDCFV
jgi:hypothetical protein